MAGFKAKCRIAAVLVFSIWMGLVALYGLLKPVPNGCNMTYMYPTYIPISSPANVSFEKYGLFLYHEGWKKIDFKEHLKKLSGIPVLFIPGNGGSYKQVRSLAAESDRAYQGGPLEPTFYMEASFTPEERGHDMILEDANGFMASTQYNYMLDWFAVDLEEEHSAMDGGILEEHAEYVVYAIHRILDQYKESYNARSKEGAETYGRLPKSVILVGHSMGGFVARAAVVHSHLRKSAVETVLTLSSPHQSPPVALQPSLGLLYSRVNSAWRKGYEMHTTHMGRRVSDPSLFDVVVVSVSGGIRDFQVRSKLAALDGIVPPTHGFMIGTTGMKNVWLSMEHQSILWCNQLVIQVSHTLLSLIDSESGQPFVSTHKRLAIFSKMLRSGVPQSFNWVRDAKLPRSSQHNTVGDEKNIVGHSIFSGRYSPCPQSFHWTEETLERDLYIQSTTVTVLAMDGRRRWMDIRELGSNGKDHFVFVTNLSPCSGVRLHLWPEKTKTSTEEEFSASNRVLEVTSKMVNIPAGPAPRQIEPGSQTEQAPPSAVLQLGPEDMHGFRFLTISVAPRPTVSGRPPPAASMAVGQFFNPKEGEREFSPKSLLLSSYVQEEILLKEDHPLVLNLSFSISMGLLPVTLSLKTTGCGIKKSGLPMEQAGDAEQSSLCKLRCFPPAALVWDSTSGLNIIPNLYSETIIVDSSPVFWGSTHGSDKTTVLLMIDPHCSYKINAVVSTTAAASRFLLLHHSQIIGFCIAVIFFALMRQARAWELDQPLPSMLTALESNLRLPLPFLILSVFPVFLSMFFSLLASQPIPPFTSFAVVSVICYSVANGSMIILSLSSQMVFYVAATVQVFIKQWCQVWEQKLHITFHHQSLNCFSIFSSFKVVRILGGNPTLVVALVTVPLVFFVHPALGLFVLLISHASCCHSALCSFLAASFRSHAQRKEKWLDSRTNGDPPGQSRAKSGDSFDPLLPVEESNSNSPDSARSFCDTQLEVFQYQQGLLILHLVAVLLLVPSLVAWVQRIGIGQGIPWFIDSVLSVGIILHGLCASKPAYNVLLFALPGTCDTEAGLSFVYLLAGLYCCISALALAPYRAFYAMATVGIISFIFRIVERRNREKGDAYFSTRKHSHKH